MSPPRSGPLGQLWQEGMQRTHKWKSKHEAAQTQRMTEQNQNKQSVGAGVGTAVADAGLFSKVL